MRHAGLECLVLHLKNGFADVLVPEDLCLLCVRRSAIFSTPDGLPGDNHEMNFSFSVLDISEAHSFW